MQTDELQRAVRVIRARIGDQTVVSASRLRADVGLATSPLPHQRHRLTPA